MSRSTVYIPINAILVDDRVRQDYKDIDNLAESIQHDGLLHPPVVSCEGDKFRLVVGGRRVEAHRHLKRETVEVFILESLSPARLALLEAQENFQRVDFHWSESIMAIHRVHSLSRNEAFGRGENWTQQATAKLLNVSQASVSVALALVPHIKAKDQEILAATGPTNAWQVLLEREEKRVKAALVAGVNSLDSILAVDLSTQSTKPRGNAVTDAVAAVSRTPSVISVQLEDDFFSQGGAAAGPTVDLSEVPALVSPAPQQTIEIPVSKMVLLGDAIELLNKMADESVNHVFTDPPYGIDMANLATGYTNIEGVADTHDVEQNKRLLQLLFPKLFRVLKPNGFVFLWYDLDHHEKLQQWAANAGFSVQRWPLIWHKLSPCRNSAPGYNTTKNYECCLVLRKGGTLPRPVTSSVFAHTNDIAEKQLLSHPFYKPGPVWKWLFEMVTSRGDTVLDPFCGAGSMLVAAVDYGLKPIGFELDEAHYNTCMVHLHDYFKNVFPHQVKLV